MLHIKLNLYVHVTPSLSPTLQLLTLNVSACFQYEAAYIGFPLNKPGGDNKYEEIKTALDCQKLCLGKTGCKWFNLDENGCWLKTVKGRRDNKPGGVTGPKSCSAGEEEGMN